MLGTVLGAFIDLNQSTNFPCSYIIAFMEPELRDVPVVYTHKYGEQHWVNQACSTGYQNKGLKQMDLGQMENILPCRNFWTVLPRGGCRKEPQTPPCEKKARQQV